jgi:hypothetical protein
MLNAFERRLLPFPLPGQFFHFGSVFFGADVPRLPQGWSPDNAVVGRFHDYLRQQGVIFTDAEFDANKPWVEESLKCEFYSRAFEKRSADHLIWSGDPEVKQAVDSLPRAHALLEQVKRAMLRRTAG